MSRNALSRRLSRENTARRNRFLGKRLQENARFRHLRHEQLEDRRLLTGVEITIDDVTVTEGDEAGVFVGDFAPQPGLAGVLGGPTDMTLGPDGNLYVASHSSDEVLRYDRETGDLIDVFVAAGSGGLHLPWGLAFGPDGNLYVSSNGTNDILRFDGTSGLPIDDGVFVPAGSAGLDGAGQFTFRPDGFLYVISFQSDEVLRYDATSGEPVGDGVFVSAGSAGLDGPSSLLWDADGNLLVTSYLTDEILRYDATGSPVGDGEFVSSGSGGLDGPHGLTYADGHYYVASAESNAILQYDAHGAFVDEFIPSQSNGMSYPLEPLFSPEGYLLVAANGNGVMKFNASTGAYIDIFVDSHPLRAPHDIALGPDGNVYVNNYSGGSVLRYDGTTGAFIDTFVPPLSGGFDGAVGMAFGPDGNLYMASWSQDRVVAFDGTDGSFLGEIVPPGPSMDGPRGIAFGPDGNLYIASEKCHSVLKYNLSTEELSVFVPDGSGGNGGTSGITFGPEDGHLYVTRYGTNNVYRYDGATGELIDLFANGAQLNNAQNIVFGPDGDLYLASWGDNRIVHYDGTTGGRIDDVVPGGDARLLNPWGMLFNSDNQLLVVGTNSAKVLRYHTDPVAPFTVTLSHSSDLPVNVDFSTADGTATAESDYEPISGTLTFAPGETSKTIIVPTIDDAVAEHTETFEVELSNPTAATISHVTGTATILDPITYQSTDVPKDLINPKKGNQVGVTTSTLDVVGSGKIYDLDVQLDIFHFNVTELSAILIAPDGTPVELFSNVGGNGRFFIDTVFDDEASTPITAASAPFRGRFQPEGNLAAFDDMDPTGTWTLQITDNDKFYLGRLDRWSILVSTYEPTPNDPPVAVNDGTTTNEDVAVAIGVLTNDSDPDFDPLTIDAVTQGANGTVAIDGSEVIYTPDANFFGSDSFTYTIVDGRGGTDMATVGVSVAPVNDAPVAVGDSHLMEENETLTVAAPGLLGNDTDVDGDSLTAVLVTDVSSGSLMLNADGSFTYTPNTDFFGTDSFTYKADDGPLESNVVQATITVTEFNYDPDAVDDSATTAEDTAVDVYVLDNDSDADGDSLTVASVSAASHGTVTISNSNGFVTYTPDRDFNGGDSFTYTVSDGKGGMAVATVNVDVTSVNDDPVAVDDSDTTDGGVAVTINVLANDTDVDGDTLSVDWFTQATNGTVSDNGDGTLTYDPDIGFGGNDSFTYTVTDGEGGFDTATVSVTVQSTSDMHVADLDGTANSINKRKWTATATILVVDASGTPVPNATVQGMWGNGVASSDATDSDGLASVTSTNVNKGTDISFTVTGILHATLEYDATNNSDPDGDSNGTTIVVTDGQALMAAGGLSIAPTEELTRGMAEAITAQAISLWSQQLVTVPPINVKVADLPAGTLGWANGDTITLDVNANGAGWNTNLNAPVAGQFDLLTVATHEIGHLLGYGHSANTHDVMASTLPVGTRRLPGLEPSMMEPALVASLPNLQVNTRTPVVELPTPAKSLDPVAETNFDLFLAPLVMDRVQQITGRPEAVDIRMLDDILDDETEIVEEELLDLLLG